MALAPPGKGPHLCSCPTPSFTTLHAALLIFVETIIVIVIVTEFYGGSGMVLHFFAGVETIKEGYSSDKYCGVAVRTDSTPLVTRPRTIVICDA